MITVNVTPDEETLNELKSLMSVMGAKALPNSKSAFRDSTALVKSTWQAWARGESLPEVANVKNPSAKLAASIHSEFRNDFDSEISSKSPEMKSIIDGKKEYDMKNDAYLRGKKSRVSDKDKLPYLIIPFRWGTPNDKGGERAHFSNSIPAQFYEMMMKQKMKKSRRTGDTHPELNARGQAIDRSEYEWGDRVKAEGNINGLVRMIDGTKSTYFTFRVISAKQIGTKKWVRKAVPGIDITRAIVKQTEPFILQMMEEGLKADLQ